ncbi:NUDIX hydrolase [Virgibacillus senegalensis]|uniref:hypothetical protein n=1 Tax=Virgibacillus senegalensis TaxID=1499679 RepID=UPI000A7FE6AC|nr:hypothetical protein [Virgibacillus senegalensis]
MEYYKYLRQFVGHRPLILPGSVVIILNEQNQVLLQKRRDAKEESLPKKINFA